MRKHIYRIVMLAVGLFMIVGCTTEDKEASVNNRVEGENHSNRIENSDFTFASSFFSWEEVDGGFYIKSSWATDPLMFWDEATNQLVVLCGKPECDHADTDCDAIQGINHLAVEFYEGKIYYWKTSEFDEPNSGSDMCRMNPDGSEQEVIQSFDYGTPQYTNPTYGFIHDGYWYMRELSGQNPYGGNHYRLTRRDINGEKDYEVIFEPEETATQTGCKIGSLRIYEGGLYYSTQYTSKDGSMNPYEVYRYDLASGKTEKIWEHSAVFVYVMEGDTLYYSEVIGVETYGPVKKVNWKTGEEEVFLEKGGNLTFDGKYLYVQPGIGQGIDVYTLEQKLVDHVEAETSEQEYYTYTTGKYILFYWDADGAQVRHYQLLSKEMIGEKEKEYITLEEPIKL